MVDGDNIPNVTVSEYEAVEKGSNRSSGTFNLKNAVDVTWYSANGKWVSDFFPVYMSDSGLYKTTYSPSFPGFGHGVVQATNQSYDVLERSDGAKFEQLFYPIMCDGCSTLDEQFWFVYVKDGSFATATAALAAVDTAASSSSSRTVVSASTAVAIASFVVLVIIMALVAAGLGMFVTYKNQSRALGTQM